MKRYKIDFNNGKVFEGVKDPCKEDCYEVFLAEGKLMRLQERYAKELGATITEMEEQRAHFAISLYKNRAPDVFLNAYDAAANIDYMHDRIVNVVELREGESICPVGSVAVDREKLINTLRKVFGPIDTKVIDKINQELGLE